MTDHFDSIVIVIVIDTGQAGPSMTGRLTDTGTTVAVVERHLIGGTCVNTGSSRPRRWSPPPMLPIRRAADSDVITGSVNTDMARVHARSQKVSVDGRTSNEAWLLSMAGFTLIFGHAGFESVKTWAD